MGVTSWVAAIVGTVMYYLGFVLATILKDWQLNKSGIVLDPRKRGRYICGHIADARRDIERYKTGE